MSYWDVYEHGRDVELFNEHSVHQRAAEAKSKPEENDGVNPHCGSFQRCSVSPTA